MPLDSIIFATYTLTIQGLCGLASPEKAMDELDARLGVSIASTVTTAANPTTTVAWGESSEAQAGQRAMMRLVGAPPANWRELAEAKRREVEARERDR